VGIVAAQGTTRGRNYDPATVETLHAEVLAVEYVTQATGGARGVHLVLGTAAGPVTAHLGPEWYVSRQAIRIDAGDTVEVTGSRVLFEGEPALIAAEVVKGEESLILRDDRGIPMWSRGRRRR
jgi:hypothetical protein